MSCMGINKFVSFLQHIPKHFYFKSFPHMVTGQDIRQCSKVYVFSTAMPIYIVFINVYKLSCFLIHILGAIRRGNSIL